MGLSRALTKCQGAACFASIILLLLSSATWGAEGVDLSGNWLGMVKVPQGALRLVMHLARDAHGAYTGTLDVPEQQAKDLPISGVTQARSDFRINVDLIAASFTGKISGDGNTISGAWKQGKDELPLTFTRMVKPLAELVRSQNPKPPYPYASEEVTFPNPAAGGVMLAGTLTLPRGKGPFPAVLLITGSGLQDRNESIFGHKPFLIIADYLTRRGIAVLRVDDRGAGKSTGDATKATMEDFAGDALAGVRFLKGRAEIDAARIGLVGHSEGGMIAPMIAASSPTDIAFIVLLAAPGLPGEQLLLLQTESINRLSGMDDEAVARNVALVRELIAIVTRETDAGKAEQALRVALQTAIDKLPEAQRTAIANSDEFLKSQLTLFCAPAMRFFLAYDPVPALGKVKCPLLALNGELDRQVPCRENLAGLLAGLSQAMKSGGTADCQIQVLPGLNHLFQTCTTGSPAEYPLIEETFAPAALQVMGEWILEHTRSDAVKHGGR